MPSDKPQQSLADFVAIAISPALIMALVGSLVFFLLEVLYVGRYEGRMQWILFFFVFGIVLIARISMQAEIASRASLYGLILGGLVYLGLLRFVDYPPGVLGNLSWAVNLGLMAVVWWSAHKLTWDCTLIDDSVDASGKGLLQVAGVDEPDTEEGQKTEGQRTKDAGRKTQDEGDTEGEEKAAGKRKKNKKEAEGFFGWFQRYRRYREERARQPHAPGVWVVYFSLAALPLFGLGQSLIPPGEISSRKYAFWMMGIYVASGLGLLLTTSFLGLRRYLRQRNLRMPLAMTGVWLGLGGSLAAALLVAGAVLPRPNAEYPVLRWSRLTGKDREASRFSVKGDSPGKGEGSSSSEKPSGNEQSTSGSGTKSDSQDGNKAEGKSGDSSSQGQPNEQGQGQSSQNSRDSQSGQDGKSEGKGQNSDSKDGSPDRQGKPEGRSGSQSPPRTSPDNPLSRLSGNMPPVLKWIVFGIMGLVVACIVLYAVVKFLANFTHWAKDLLASLRAWWQGLFGWLQRGPRAEEVVDDTTMAPEPRRFASFQNPFRDGTAERSAPEDLVRYTFEALEALAWERGAGRHAQETPLEFGDRIGDDMPGLDAQARQLSNLYVQAAYGPGRLPPSSVETLRQVWRRLEAAEEAPLSA